MTTLLVSIVTLFIFALINHLIGDKEGWQAKVKEFVDIPGRVFAYGSAAIMLLVLCMVYGLPFLQGIIATLLLTITYIWARQRSPRGVFFLLHEKLNPAYTGKHSPITEKLAMLTSGIAWYQALAANHHAKLLKYARHYGYIHVTWVLAVMAIPLTLFVSTATAFFIPLGLLMTPIHHHASVRGWRGREQGARAFAEKLMGAFVYGGFSVGVIATASVFGGWLI